MASGVERVAVVTIRKLGEILNDSDRIIGKKPAFVMAFRRVSTP
jgi:hypothetical protein